VTGDIESPSEMSLIIVDVFLGMFKLCVPMELNPFLLSFPLIFGPQYSEKDFSVARVRPLFSVVSIFSFLFSSL